jgi:cation diffusion facilitator CzcD-associated flavoprotein CzcO
MARATITLASSAAPDEELRTEFVIVGGGICGILAAKQCSDRQWPYLVIERNAELGGVWGTLANNHSYLQVRGTPHAVCFWVVVAKGVERDM